MCNVSNVGNPSINMPFSGDSAPQAAPSKESSGPINNLGGIVNSLFGGGGLPLINDLVDVAPNIAIGSTINNQQGAGPAQAAAPAPAAAAPAAQSEACAAPACAAPVAAVPLPQTSVAPAAASGPAINNFAGIVNAGRSGGGGALVNDAVDVAPNFVIGSSINSTQAA